MNICRAGITQRQEGTQRSTVQRLTEPKHGAGTQRCMLWRHKPICGGLHGSRGPIPGSFAFETQP